jgi:DNA-binding response OmpR family regulator
LRLGAKRRQMTWEAGPVGVDDELRMRNDRDPMEGDAGSTLRMRRRTIVVFDDSPIILEAFATALEENGFAVRTAKNLQELDKHCRECKPDLFMLDVQTPEAFGDDIGRVLREVRGMKVPILLVSSLDEAALAERAREAGLSGYVSKRAGIDAVLERVTALLSDASATTV